VVAQWRHVVSVDEVPPRCLVEAALLRVFKVGLSVTKLPR
jgi:hypothetical protein